MRPRRIIVLKVDHIGDFVLAGSAIADLRRACQNGHLTLVCASTIRELAASLGVFDDIVAFDFYPRGVDAPGSKPHADYASIRSHVSGAYDLAIDLRHDLDTRPLLDHIDAKFRAGFEGGELVHPLDLSLPRFDDLPRPSPQRFGPHAETRMRLLAMAVVDTFFCDAERAAPPTRSGRVRRIDSDYFVLAPGSAVRLKNWDVLKFTVLARRLIARLGMPAVIVGGPAEEEDAGSISAEIPGAKCINLAGRLSLIELQDVIRDSTLLVGNNTGPTHMAARLGVPTVCVFSGRADPKIWRPRGPYVRVVQARQPCAPCHLSDESQCNFGKACTREITTKMVMRACKTVLKRRRNSPSGQPAWWRFDRSVRPYPKTKSSRQLVGVSRSRRRT